LDLVKKSLIVKSLNGTFREVTCLGLDK